VLIGESLTVKGRILREDSRLVEVKGEILDSEGRVLARSKAEFVMVSEEKLSSVPEGLKRDMKELFMKMGET